MISVNFRSSILISLTLGFMLPIFFAQANDRSLVVAPHADMKPVIDGIADDSAWAAADWTNIDYLWLGPEYSEADFSGRFKVTWSGTRIYILAEITDDVLFDAHRDPLTQYWDDDCLEVFLDEDYSGGNHQYSHNAFAYHMSLDNQAIDIGRNKKAQNYSHHVSSRWQQTGDKIIWEVAIDIYGADYVDGSDANEPLSLSVGKELGFMVAYCDNDGSEFRENFIGSVPIATGAKDRGYIDADIFGKMVLHE